MNIHVSNSLNFGPEDLIIAAEMLKINTNLTSLSLRNNNLIGSGSEYHACEILAEWLAEASNLTKLDLSHTNLRDPGCVRISKGLEKHAALKVRSSFGQTPPLSFWRGQNRSKSVVASICVSCLCIRTKSLMLQCALTLLLVLVAPEPLCMHIYIKELLLQYSLCCSVCVCSVCASCIYICTKCLVPQDPLANCLWW
jgi:hypothetical protein